MTLYLDSAVMDEVRQAATWGFIGGATTNPILITRSGMPPEETILALCDSLPGTIFYQLAAATPDERYEEAVRFAALRPGRVGLKITCTFENMALCARLSKDGYICGMTAAYSPAQVYLAVQAGARYVLPYVNRATRQTGDGLQMIRDMRAVIDAERSSTEIIAASIRSPGEAAATVIAGAHHLTVPFAYIVELGQHDLSDKAIDEFDRAWAARS